MLLVHQAQRGVPRVHRRTIRYRVRCQSVPELRERDTIEHRVIGGVHRTDRHEVELQRVERDVGAAMSLGLSMSLPRPIEQQVRERTFCVGNAIASHLPDGDRQFGEHLLDLPPVEPASMPQHRDECDDDDLLGDRSVRTIPEHETNHPVRVRTDHADSCDKLAQRRGAFLADRPIRRELGAGSREESLFKVLAQSHALDAECLDSHDHTPDHSLGRRSATPAERHGGAGPIDT